METKKIIKLHMIDADISSFRELSERTGIDYQRLNKRVKSPETFHIYEIRALDRLFHFTDEELLSLLRGAK